MAVRVSVAVSVAVAAEAVLGVLALHRRIDAVLALLLLRTSSAAGNAKPFVRPVGEDGEILQVVGVCLCNQAAPWSFFTRPEAGHNESQ